MTSSNPYAAASDAAPDNSPRPTLFIDVGEGADTVTGLPTADTSGSSVPAGTVVEVLTWVGTDSDRAEQAYAVEIASAHPRKGLITALEKQYGA